MHACRPLRLEDAAAWRALRLIGVRAFPWGFLATPEELEAQDLRACQEILAQGAYHGVFAGEALAGFCGLHRQRLRSTRHRAEIGPFFVAPEHHGTGAAQALMAHVIAAAREAGLAQLELGVQPENARAVAFYERQGYVRFGRHPDFARAADGTSEDELLYRRVLD
ncbi:MAG: GNAT family N-acetyltransferase [Pseudomonadota bacterium]